MKGLQHEKPFSGPVVSIIQARGGARGRIDVPLDYVYWIFWIFIGLLIGLRARPQTPRAIFRILMLGAAFVLSGVVVGLGSGHSAAQLLVFDAEIVTVAGLELRLIVFGYTLILAGLLLELRARGARKPASRSGWANE